MSCPAVEPIASPVWVGRAYRVAQCLGSDAPVKPCDLVREVRRELKCSPAFAAQSLAAAEAIGLVQFDGYGWRAVGWVGWLTDCE